jgi:hypothetical protein
LEPPIIDKRGCIKIVRRSAVALTYLAGQEKTVWINDLQLILWLVLRR